MNKYSKNTDMKSLRKDMADMKKEEINELMISLLSFEDASEIMIKSCGKIVKSLCGEKIFLQRRATTIFVCVCVCVLGRIKEDNGHIMN